MTLVDELAALPLLEGMDEPRLRLLADGGDVVGFVAGDVLWTEAAPAEFWWVLLEGQIDLVRRDGREDTVVGRFDAPGRWAGGFRAWDDTGVYLATGRATSSGRMLRVPAPVLRDVLAGYPLVTHLVEGLFRTARNIEGVARQRDALVALGRISAGLAHEINNPASAAARAVDALKEASGTLLSCLARLAEGGIAASAFTELDRLRLEVSGRETTRGALELADREDELSRWMGGHGVERDWVIAPPLAAAGVDVAWCERVAGLLPDDVLEAGLEWVASTLTLSTLLGEVAEATRRVTDLVGAVKSYSQMDRGSMQRVDVTDGIDSTLAMLGHRLHGVTVVRDYGADVPDLDVFAGELNQVWTNLVDNAVDAMDGSGTLRVSTRLEGDHVVVEVADSGPGMPADVAAHAFDAFFTTKELGRGTGLGLDIARRIVVERHHGEISVASTTGGTTMRVRLPLRLAAG